MIIEVDDYSLDQMNVSFKIGYQRDNVDSNHIEPAFKVTATGDCILVSDPKVKSRRERDLRSINQSSIYMEVWVRSIVVSKLCCGCRVFRVPLNAEGGLAIC